MRSHVATGGFNRGLTEDLAQAASNSWENNRSEGFSAMQGGRATASLSYEIDWR